jgi:hypothetical protein
MADQDAFRAALLERIRRAREAVFRAEAHAAEAAKEAEVQRSRRDAAVRLYEVEFGEVPPTAVKVTPPPRSTKMRLRSRADLPRSGVDGPLSGLTWQDALHAVLAESEALHVREIWDRLDAGGFTTSASDPLRSIVAVALRTPGIVRAAPNTYTLIEREPTGDPAEKAQG